MTTGRFSRLAGGAYEWKDLRRTVGTRLAALCFKEETIGRALNHARYTVTARHYIKHAYTAEVGRALEAWDRLVNEIVAGHASESRKVRAFRSRGERAPKLATRDRPSGRLMTSSLTGGQGARMVRRRQASKRQQHLTHI